MIKKFLLSDILKRKGGNILSQSPEEDLSHQFQQQEYALHGNLFMLNQLFKICSHTSLSVDDVMKQASHILQEFSKTNPAVAKELHEVLETGDKSKINEYFTKEKDAIIETLTTEMQQNKSYQEYMNRKLEDEKPTDS